jgi:hypothetical protein
VRFIRRDQGVLDDVPIDAAAAQSQPDRVAVVSQPTLLAGPIPPRVAMTNAPSSGPGNPFVSPFDPETESDSPAVDEDTTYPNVPLPPTPTPVPVIDMSLSVGAVELVAFNATSITGNSSLGPVAPSSGVGGSSTSTAPPLPSAGVLHLHRLGLKNLPHVPATSSLVPPSLRTTIKLALPLWTFSFQRPGAPPMLPPAAATAPTDASQGLAQAGVQLVLKDLTIQLPEEEYVALLVRIRLGAAGTLLAARARQATRAQLTARSDTASVLTALAHSVLAGVWELQGAVPGADSTTTSSSNSTAIACSRTDAEGEAGLVGQCILAARYSGWGALGQRIQFVPSAPMAAATYASLLSFSVARLQAAVEALDAQPPSPAPGSVQPTLQPSPAFTQNPPDTSTGAPSSSSDSKDSTAMALGVGLGVGLGGSCLILAAVAGVWYWAGKKRRAAYAASKVSNSNSMEGRSRWGTSQLCM